MNESINESSVSRRDHSQLKINAIHDAMRPIFRAIKILCHARANGHCGTFQGSLTSRYMAKKYNFCLAIFDF